MFPAVDESSRLKLLNNKILLACSMTMNMLFKVSDNNLTLYGHHDSIFSKQLSCLFVWFQRCVYCVTLIIYHSYGLLLTCCMLINASSLLTIGYILNHHVLEVVFCLESNRCILTTPSTNKKTCQIILL